MRTTYKSVLVIDDHKMVANGIKLIIGDLFENFYMAHDGATGMSYALQHFPDLIVVDGGKGHIAAALDVLVNELGLDVPVCGLAKDAKHRTSQLLVGDPPEVVPLPRDSQEFYLLQRIQDEVHRFAITFHREKRAKSMVASRLDAIPGIGEKRRKQLLSHFGSLKAIKEASVDDFKAVSIGEALAQRILDTLNAE